MQHILTFGMFFVTNRQVRYITFCTVPQNSQKSLEFFCPMNLV